MAEPMTPAELCEEARTVANEIHGVPTFACVPRYFQDEPGNIVRGEQEELRVLMVIDARKLWAAISRAKELLPKLAREIDRLCGDVKAETDLRRQWSKKARELEAERDAADESRYLRTPNLCQACGDVYPYDAAHECGGARDFTLTSAPAEVGKPMADERLKEIERMRAHTLIESELIAEVERLREIEPRALVAEVRRLESFASGLEKQNAEQHKQIAELESQVERPRAKLEQRIAELEKQRDVSVAEIARLREKNKFPRADQAQRIAETERTLEDYRRNNAELRAQVTKEYERGHQCGVQAEHARFAHVMKSVVAWSEGALNEKRPGGAISLEEAKLYRRCRICGNPVEYQPITYDYGREHAHTSCLEAARAKP